MIVVQASLAALFDPAKNALLPALVDGDRLVSANSLVGLGTGVARLAGGPLLAAWGDLAGDRSPWPPWRRRRSAPWT